MITIKTKYNFDTNIMSLKKYSYKHTCSYEHLALIDRLIAELISRGGFETREQVLTALKKPLTTMLGDEKEYEYDKTNSKRNEE